MKRFFATCLCSLGILTGWSQQGHYFLTHFRPANDAINYRTTDMTQDDRGMLYFATRAGVLQFDGRNWYNIAVPYPVLSVSAGAGQLIGAAGVHGMGRIGVNSKHHFVFNSLTDTTKRKLYRTTVSHEGKLWAITEDQLVRVSQEGQLHEISSPTGSALTGLFLVNEKLYITTEDHYLLELVDESLKPSRLLPSGAGDVAFAASIAGLSVVYTSAGRCFTIVGNKATEVKLKDAEYLSAAGPVHGAFVSSDLLAIGTLRGGVVFVNPATGETSEIVNYHSGLPDNEVMAMTVDRDNGIWVAHEYGFSRIAPEMPFRSFSHYNGLEGNLLCAATYGGSHYVGTSLGLFKLEKAELYDEMVYFVETSGGNEQVTTAGTAEEPTKKKGLFGFLKKKKKQDASKETVQAKPKLERRTRRVLRGLQYSYHKVDGIQGKVNNLLTVNGHLLAAGLSGLSDVSGTKSKPVVATPVRAVFLSPSLKELWVSTYEGNIRTLKPTGTTWTDTHRLDTLYDDINYFFEDKFENLWLCGRSAVYKATIEDGQLTSIGSVPFDHPYQDETVGVSIGNEIYLAASGQFHSYDAAEDKFIPYDSLPGPRKYFASGGSFWFNDGHRWRTVDPRQEKKNHFEWLSLFEDIRFIAPSEDGYWVITATNELYRFDPRQVGERKTKFPLQLRSIYTTQNSLGANTNVVVNQLENSLTFEFVQPEYVGMNTVEYRYRTRGLSSEWSAWAASNYQINFPFLPVGNYQLEVQARDLFGTVNELVDVSFRITPPYWKQSWFYALEVVFFGVLVLLSMQLGSINPRLRVVSQVLSMLTVIMLIQLLQTGIASYITLKSSPVIEFFLQVIMALLVLPVESYLRRMLSKPLKSTFVAEIKNDSPPSTIS
ncbi:MAG: hypothetical protein K1X47_00515 [Cyclobacteriaceae bacterium]|nr:hypothetical protein [Cyclobacteriaceae bacterium]